MTLKEETRIILKMVKESTITVDEGVRLFEAMDEPLEIELIAHLQPIPPLPPMPKMPPMPPIPPMPKMPPMPPESPRLSSDK